MAAWYLSFSHALPPLSAGLKVHAFSAYASCGRPRQQKDRGYRARRRPSGGLDTRRASKARLAPLGKGPQPRPQEHLHITLIGLAINKSPEPR